jgi:uncharacterized protein DUF3145
MSFVGRIHVHGEPAGEGAARAEDEGDADVRTPHDARPRGQEPAWIPQPAQSGTYRTELSWSGDTGSAAAIASALRGWNHLRFEVTEDPTSTSEGQRYSYTPELGVFHAVTGLHGDIMIPEDRLKAAVVKAALGDTTLLVEIDKLLGKPWDDELEPFRHAGDGAPVRWLHHVV